MKSKRENVPTLAVFTLVELLFIIAIIAILVSLLLPALRNARERGQEITCKSRMRQSGFAFSSYAGDNGGWIPAVYYNTTACSWLPGGPYTNADANWSWKLAEQGYVPVPTTFKNPTVTICPLHFAKKYSGAYPSFGMNSYMGFKPTSTSLSDCPKNILKLKKVTTNVLIADGVTDVDGNVASYPAVSGPYHGRYMSTRHFNGSNILYLDMHVDWKKWVATLDAETYMVE